MAEMTEQGYLAQAIQDVAGHEWQEESEIIAYAVVQRERVLRMEDALGRIAEVNPECDCMLYAQRNPASTIWCHPCIARDALASKEGQL